MGKTSGDMRIALFIDFENLVTRTGLTAENFDLHPVISKLLEKGKVVYRRAYCDWGRFGVAKPNLHDWGVELVDVPPSTRSGKNGADMRLVIDALELAYLREHVDAFVIASGDSDFCPLAYKLRENNRTVIGMGIRGATSPLFVKACDEFIYIRPPAARASRDRGERRPVAAPAPMPEPVAPPAAPAPESPVADALEPQPEPAAPAAPPKPGRRRRAPRAASSAPAPAAAPAPQPQAPRPQPAQPRPQPGQKKPQLVPQVAREVAAAILARATEPVNPSLIKEAIVRKEPDFDVRDYGFSTFSRLLEVLEKEGSLKRQRTPSGHLLVTLP